MKGGRFVFVGAAAVGITAAALLLVEHRTSQISAQIEAITGARLVIASTDTFNFDRRIDSSEPRRLQVLMALGQLKDALAVYPSGLLKQAPANILITGRLTISDHVVGGTVQQPGWVLLATDYVFPGANADYVERVFHHEYSSLLIAAHPFPMDEWNIHLPQGFAFPTTDAERLAATQTYAENLQPYHRRGFVSDYGASSPENDINTYAELLLFSPDVLAALAQDHDLIHKKTLLIKGYYEGLHPAFAGQFASTALDDL